MRYMPVFLISDIFLCSRNDKSIPPQQRKPVSMKTKNKNSPNIIWTNFCFKDIAIKDPLAIFLGGSPGTTAAVRVITSLVPERREAAIGQTRKLRKKYPIASAETAAGSSRNFTL